MMLLDAQNGVLAHQPLRVEAKTGIRDASGRYGHLLSVLYHSMTGWNGKEAEIVRYNGRFYTHHVPENPEVERGLGVDQSTQVSLSNAYSLNRNLDQEQRHSG